MVFKESAAFRYFFNTIIVIFILSIAVTLYFRDGRDLKVGLFGVEQVAKKSSPYYNPTDKNRTIFRYAPGITILQAPFMLTSKQISPFEFKDIKPSVYSWFLVEIIGLLISAFILFKLIPSLSKEVSVHNLKLSFLMALPLIGYELTNSQNKIIALAFVLLAIFCFEKKYFFASAFFLSWAMTIYIPLGFFVFYFVLRSKGKFILPFILGGAVTFIIIPTIIFGFNFNLFLLQEWFELSLKPFIFTATHSSYIDLRHSSQSLPSTIGRIFVSGHTGTFKYSISPFAIHAIVRVFSLVMFIFSCFVVWKSSKGSQRSLGYIIFLSLALLLPQYCIYYTWSWLFVFYFILLNYAQQPGISQFQKKILSITIIALFISSLTLVSDLLSKLSFIFWGTVIGWIGIVTLLTIPRAEKVFTDTSL